MSSDSTLPTLLEHLPVEIFFQIFGSLPLREIATTFFGLNSYIDSIIRSVRSVSHLVSYNDVNAIKDLHLLPTVISRLIVVNVEMVDFTALINLRSLTLKYGTQAQFNGIRPQHFPTLKSLYIKGVHSTMNGDTETIINLFQIILSNGFPRLRICAAFDIGALAFSNKWLGSPALHILNLNMKTTHDSEQLHSVCPHLRQLTTYESSVIDPIPAFHGAKNKRIFNELQKLKRLEAENKFILGVNPITTFGSNKPLSRFNNMTPRFHGTNTAVIQGRILPQSKPYCHASFLIEIVLPPEYPFKDPEVIIRDPIYHPNVDDSGRHCCCWGFSCNESFKPTTSLADIIEAVIRVIDNPDYSHSCNPERTVEYQNDYQKFYKKALKLTLLHGRPRY